MIIMKFGGTSIGSASQIQKVAEIITSHVHKQPLIVISAFSGITNLLVTLSERAASGQIFDTTAYRLRHERVMQELDLPQSLLLQEYDELDSLLKGVSLLRECSARTKDRILAFGEEASAKIVGHYLKRKLVSSIKIVSAYNLGLITNSDFGKATPTSLELIPEKMSLFENEIVVTTGFIAKDILGNITTLGRNGSDYSAALFGAALQVEEVQIWKDVSGLMTANPNLIPDASPVTELSFEEAAELAYYGAKVLHPSTILPLVQKNIPVRILNTNAPMDPGTLIYNNKVQQHGSVKSIAHRSGLVIINITSTRMLAQHGFLSKIFNLFSSHQIIIDMVSTSEVSVSLTTEEGQIFDGLLSELQNFADISFENGFSVISIVGEGVREDPSVTAKAFSILYQSEIPVRMISMGASKINLSIIIENTYLKPALRALHSNFFPLENKQIEGREAEPPLL